MKRRVVITGLGVVAPSGIGKDAFCKILKVGKSCVDRITSFDPSNHSSQIAAEIKDFSPEDYINPTEIRRMDRSTHLAVAGTKLAIADANLNIKKEGRNREIGVIIGTGGSGIGFAEKEMYLFWSKGIKKVHPYASISSFCGALSSGISIELGLRGPSLTLSTGCTGSSDAIGYAFNLIRFGLANIIISGGSDACVTPAIVAGFCRINAVSTRRNHEPQKASRPFDRERDGFVISEGAYILILEELNCALRRGARIYAEIIGYGATCDAYHMTRPLPSGKETANAMIIALKDGEVKPEEVDYINAHGTSTVLNDSIETKAIKITFGEHAKKLAISSTKSMMGHPQGASGAMGITAIILGMQNDFIPPTTNYEYPDPECDLDYVPNIARESRIDTALCSSIGFGSKNSMILIRKFK